MREVIFLQILSVELPSRFYRGVLYQIESRMEGTRYMCQGGGTG